MKTALTAQKPLMLLIAVVIAGALVSGALADLVHSAQEEIQLSGSGNLAAEPRAAIAESGDYLAAVWIESEESGLYRGDVMLKRGVWNASQATYVWDPTSVTVFDADGTGCYLYADIDIQGKVAHVATAFQNPCQASLNPFYIHIAYRRYDLEQQTLSDPQTIVQYAGNPGFIPAGVQIKTSTDPDKPYIVYGKNTGQIEYVRWDVSRTGPIGSPYVVSNDDAYRPQMAYTTGATGNYIHFLWEKRLEDQGTGYPLYRRCNEAGDCSEAVKLDHEDSVAATYPSPFLAAEGERLIAGWQRCTQGGGSGSYCRKFSIVYARSDDAGENLVGLGSGEYPHIGAIGESGGYAGTDNPHKIYRARLQPSLTLDADGLPYVAWQVATDAENLRHAITTTVAISETVGGFVWDSPPGLEIASETQDYVKPFRAPSRPDTRLKPRVAKCTSLLHARTRELRSRLRRLLHSPAGNRSQRHPHRRAHRRTHR
ncbi:MAG: hypothetical protein ACP5HM_07685 [Anaerolineae bacterium]